MTNRQVMLITGSRKGIGRYLAEYYLEAGFAVIGCSRGEGAISHPEYLHLKTDVSNEAQVGATINEARKVFGKLDVVVNNAGVAAMNHTLLTPLSTAKSIIDTNFLGTFLLCREAAKLMQSQRSGRIVNLTSVATPLGLEGESVYASSKAAVECFTKILAKELGGVGITVNAVGPTPTPTDLISGVSKKQLDKLIEQQAIKRYGEFRDISNVINFFVHPESDYVTGQVIYLGGV